MILTILYFFILLFLNGFIFFNLLNLKKDKLFLIFSLGLISICFEVLFLGYLKLLNWFSLILAPIGFLFFLIYKKKLKLNIFEFKFDKKSFLIISILILIIGVQFFTMYKGSFNYKYLEDDDPWQHAQGVRFVSEQNTFIQNIHENKIHYLAPYPPIFTSLAGVLYNLGDETIPNTLKILNIILISLGIFLAFGFFRRVTNQYTSLIISGILVALPSFMSHFIWAQSLSLILFFPAFYFIYEINDKSQLKEILITILSISVVLFTQPSTGGIFGIIVLIYFLSKLLENKLTKKNILKQKKLFLTLLFGLLLALFIYWIPMILIYGINEMGQQIGFSSSKIFKGGTTVDSSSGKIYSLNEFIFPKKFGAIDQQIGIGSGLSLILFVSLIFFLVNFFKNKKSKKNSFDLFMFLFLIFTIIGIQGDSLPYKLFPHRFWVYFSIPLAYFTGKFLSNIFFNIKPLILKNAEFKFKINDKLIKLAFILFIVILIYNTSFVYKYSVQTSYWPEHQIMIPEITQFYLNLPIKKDSKVLFLCEKQISNGLGFYSLDWKKNVVSFKKDFFKLNENQINSFLKKNNYNYFSFDVKCFINKNKTEYKKMINKLSNIKILKPLMVSKNNYVIFYKVN